MVESAGAKGGKSFLGCWATELGKAPFALVMDAGSMTAAPPSATESSSAEETGAETGSASEASSASETESATETSSETGSGTPTGTGESAPSTSSPGAAAGMVVPVGGLIGVLMGLVAAL